MLLLQVVDKISISTIIPHWTSSIHRRLNDVFAILYVGMNSSEAVIGSIQENASSDDHKEEWHGTVPQASRTALIRRLIGDEPSAYSQQAPDHKIWFLRKPMSRAKRSMCIEAVRTFRQLGPNQDVTWFASIEDQRFVLGEFKQTYLIETLWIWP